MQLIDVWRGVCRHDGIGEVMDRIAALLPPELEGSRLLVRRLDAGARRLETVAVAERGGVAVRWPRTRTELGPARLAVVQEWGRAGGIADGRRAEDRQVVRAVVPAGVPGVVLAGPLLEGGVLEGVLLLADRADRADRTEGSTVGESVLAELLEPVSVALVNDARLHELVRLREALEADKRALLVRLARQEIAEAIVGVEGGLRSVMERVEQVAGTDVPVLLLGETGTGKEVIAREIHRRSRRAAGPVVRVNCGAIPAGLIDSELFGHERGAFTGALNTRVGWFERADGGTLFLDEIGELPAEAQVRLLRVLQDGTFERVGGERTQRVDVRIVAATNQELRGMVENGGFREDLWYRIGVFPIELPPLRERAADLPALAAHFAWRAGHRLSGAPLEPSAEDVELLLSHGWPGNVRELAAVIERAAILGNGTQLELRAALGTAPARGASNVGAASRNVAGVERAAATSPGVSMDAAMRRHIEAALEATHGRIEGPFGAARRLDVNPHTLRSRMRRLGIEWRRFRDQDRLSR